MKRLFTVLMMTIVLGACGESPSDVATTGGGGGSGGDDGFIPPDTVIKTEHAVLDVYGARHPGAIAAVQSLAAQDALGDALGTAESFGYGFDAANVALAMGRADDGRDVSVALGTLSGGDARGLVLYIRLGEREVSFPLRLTGRDGAFDIIEAVDKRDIGPARQPWYHTDLADCLRAILADLQRCQHYCEACAGLCTLDAVIQLVMCVLFFMF